jgi:hypothetical protein
MASYEDLVKGFMATPQDEQERENLKLTYKKLYPLFLEDFAHRKDIELFVEVVANNIMAQLAGLSPLLTSLGRLQSGQTNLGDRIGKNLLIKKNTKLSDGSTSHATVRKDLDTFSTSSKIKTKT